MAASTVAAFVLAGALTLAAVFGFSILHVRDTIRSTATGIRKDSALDGVRFIRSKPIVLGAISLDLFAVLFGGATALLPVYADQILHAGAVAFGMLRSASGVGASVMAIVALAAHAQPSRRQDDAVRGCRLRRRDYRVRVFTKSLALDRVLGDRRAPAT